MPEQFDFIYGIISISRIVAGNDNCQNILCGCYKRQFSSHDLDFIEYNFLATWDWNLCAKHEIAEIA